MRIPARLRRPPRERLVALLLTTAIGASPGAAQSPPPAAGVAGVAGVAPARQKHPAVAFALGTLVPGLGHVYAGEDDRGNTIAAAAATPIAVGGLIELAATFSQLSCSMPSGSECRDTRRSDRAATALALIGAAVWAVGAVDAVGAARRTNERRAAPSGPRVDRPGPVAAPAGVALSAGARVRVDAPAVPLHGAVLGVAAQRGDTLLLARARPHGVETMTVRLQEVRRLDVSRGRGESARRGAILGAILGAVYGGVAEYVSPSPRSTSESRSELAAYRAGRWSGGGALVGAAVGAAVLGERWTPLIPRRAP
jgi:hypothetical protein